MTELATQQRATGRSETGLVEVCTGQRLLPEVAAAFAALQADAADAGFRLAIASAYRSFERQCTIFNAKAQGQRPVHDDAGNALDLAALPPEQALGAILRFSALPGTSRHHWGTDLDVYDAAAVPDDYVVQLTPAEVSPGGPFDDLHCWLDERMAAGDSHGFYRPYAQDRGGVAPERWHLSHAASAQTFEQALTPDLLREAWRQELGGDGLALQGLIEECLDQLFARYVTVGEGWCPRP